jgi:hypothetical protein
LHWALSLTKKESVNPPYFFFMEKMENKKMVPCALIHYRYPDLRAIPKFFKEGLA